MLWNSPFSSLPDGVTPLGVSGGHRSRLVGLVTGSRHWVARWERDRLWAPRMPNVTIHDSSSLSSDKGNLLLAWLSFLVHIWKGDSKGLSIRASECRHAESQSLWPWAAMLLWAHLILHKTCGKKNVPVTGVNLYLTSTDLETGCNLLLLVANTFLMTFHVQMGRRQPLHANVSLCSPWFSSSLIAAWWEFLSCGNQGVRALLSSTRGNVWKWHWLLLATRIPIEYQIYNSDIFNGLINPSHI